MIIKTKRTLISSIKKSDLADFYDYSHQEGVGEMAGWSHHKNIEEAKRALETMVNSGRVLAIKHIVDNKMIGHISINNDSNDNRSDTKELGFVLNRDYHNQGIMTEAVTAVVDFLFTGDIQYVYACCFQDNGASKRVIEKCGFSFDREGTYYSFPFRTEFPSYEYVYTKTDWQMNKRNDCAKL